MNKNDKWSYSFSWTQEYTSLNPVYQQAVDTDNEVKRLDFLEEQIQEMASYPDAEAIIKKVMNGTAK
jgi:hypothetical protein